MNLKSFLYLRILDSISILTQGRTQSSNSERSMNLNTSVAKMSTSSIVRLLLQTTL